MDGETLQEREHFVQRLGIARWQVTVILLMFADIVAQLLKKSIADAPVTTVRCCENGLGYCDSSDEMCPQLLRTCANA